MLGWPGLDGQLRETDDWSREGRLIMGKKPLSCSGVKNANENDANDDDDDKK